MFNMDIEAMLAEACKTSPDKERTASKSGQALSTGSSSLGGLSDISDMALDEHNSELLFKANGGKPKLAQSPVTGLGRLQHSYCKNRCSAHHRNLCTLSR